MKLLRIINAIKIQTIRILDVLSPISTAGSFVAAYSTLKSFKNRQKNIASLSKL